MTADSKAIWKLKVYKVFDFNYTVVKTGKYLNLPTYISNIIRGDKVKITKIEFHWKEGSTDIKFPQTYTDISKAQDSIYRWACDAPKGGAYDKLKYTVTWEDDNTYQGRLDIQHPSYQNSNNDLIHAMKSFLEYQSNKEQEDKEATEFLNKYFNNNFNKTEKEEPKEEKIYDTTLIAKMTRTELKKLFPKCKFSVRTENYAGGSSIHLSLMKADRKVIQDFKDISEDTLYDQQRRDGWRTIEQIKELQKERQESESHQLNHHLGEYDETKWSNGTYLTKEGHELLKKVVEIANKHNWNNSDAMTDYFDVNYYLHLNIGQWDKPFNREVA